MYICNTFCIGIEICMWLVYYALNCTGRRDFLKNIAVTGIEICFLRGKVFLSKILIEP